MPIVFFLPRGGAERRKAGRDPGSHQEAVIRSYARAASPRRVGILVVREVPRVGKVLRNRVDIGEDPEYSG